MILISSWLHAFGSGFPARNALNKENDLAGCVDGAVCEAPLMMAKDSSVLPYTCVHPPTCSAK